MGKENETSPSPLPSAITHEKSDPALALKRSIPTRMIDSFRRDPNQRVTSSGEIIDLKLEHGYRHKESDSYDVETAIENTATSPLARKLEARHVQMLAIGGAIGISLLLLFPEEISR